MQKVDIKKISVETAMEKGELLGKEQQDVGAFEILQRGGCLDFLNPLEERYACAVLRNVKLLPTVGEELLISENPFLQAVFEAGQDPDFVRRPEFEEVIRYLGERIKRDSGTKESRAALAAAKAARSLLFGTPFKGVFQGQTHCLDWALVLCLIHEIYYPEEGKIVVVPFSRFSTGKAPTRFREHFGLVWEIGERSDRENEAIVYPGVRIPFSSIRRRREDEFFSSLPRLSKIAALKIYRNWRTMGDL